MNPIAQQDSTVTAMRLKVRHLTVSPSESSLPTSVIDQALNTFILQDFPNAIKSDQLSNTYTFFTSPNIDTYYLNVNYNQSIRAPAFFEGIKGFFYKNRDEFYSMWPRTPAQINAFTGDGSTMVIPPFTIGPIPFLPGEVVIGCVSNSISEPQIKITDDGHGNLYFQHSNGIVPQPNVLGVSPQPQYIPTPLPGMPNNNLSGTVIYQGNSYQAYPGDQIQTWVGTVNYVTGLFTIDLTPVGIAPAAGSSATLWVSPYQVGRPYSLLYYNNYFKVRPVPDKTYKIEVDTYLTPVQFLATTDVPILNQWWQYVSYGAAMEILRERQDWDAVERVREGFSRQEGLVLEKQAGEEIGIRNSTIFSGSTPNQGGWYNWGGWPY